MGLEKRIKKIIGQSNTFINLLKNLPENLIYPLNIRLIVKQITSDYFIFCPAKNRAHITSVYAIEKETGLLIAPSGDCYRIYDLISGNNITVYKDKKNARI